MATSACRGAPGAREQQHETCESRDPALGQTLEVEVVRPWRDPSYRRKRLREMERARVIPGHHREGVRTVPENRRLRGHLRGVQPERNPRLTKLSKLRR